jgi:hypothetical protein
MRIEARFSRISRRGSLPRRVGRVQDESQLTIRPIALDGDHGRSRFLPTAMAGE